MKIIGIDGKEHKMDIRQSQYKMRSESACKSKLQFECGQIIKKVYPFDMILEEVPLPSTNLRADFFIPSRKIMFEIQGGQHEEYTPFFHKNKKEFRNSQDRDSLKRVWAEMNNIKFIEVSSIEELKEQLDV